MSLIFFVYISPGKTIRREGWVLILGGFVSELFSFLFVIPQFVLNNVIFHLDLCELQNWCSKLLR